MRNHLTILIFLIFSLKNITSNAQIPTDSLLQKGEKLIFLAEKQHDTSRLIDGYLLLAHTQMDLSNYTVAVGLFEHAINLLDLRKNWKIETKSLTELAIAKFKTGDAKNAILMLNKAISLSEREGLNPDLANALVERGNVYASEIDFHNSIIDYKRALGIYKSIQDYSGQANTLICLGSVYLKGGDNYNGLYFYNAAVDLAREKGLTETNDRALALIDQENKIINTFSYEDSERNSQGQQTAFIEMNKQMEAFNKKMIADSIARRKQMEEEFEKKQKKQELLLIKNKLLLSDRERKIRDLAFIDEQATLKNIQLEKQAKEKLLIISENEKKIQQSNDARLLYLWRVRLYSALAALVLILFLSFILWRNIYNKQKANLLLKLQKQQTESEKIKAEETLKRLISTQAQLIQREKMASLGELTAGIAHEIQNPINFINNFSEVNNELLIEMKGEINSGNYNEAKALADEILGNEDKINHHGKRADGIVKSMLLHSRISTGNKEFINVNSVVEEYLRIAYHGFRAKEKEFSSSIKTYYDQNIDKINIVPQDLGRVLLNLYNNAFYAVLEKKKHNTNGYEPNLNIKTNRLNGFIEISIEDNGGGIPENLLDKIFQPFFTTKPPGQGTGLGLSLSYDIIKSLGGEIKVNTHELGGTEFIVRLPLELAA